MPLKLSSESWKLLYFFWFAFYFALLLLLLLFLWWESQATARPHNELQLHRPLHSHCVKLIRKRWVGKFSTYFRVGRCCWRSHMPAKMNFQPQTLCWHANYAKLMCHAYNATPGAQAQLVLVGCCCHCMRRLIFIFKTLNAVVSQGQDQDGQAIVKAFPAAAPQQPQNAFCQCIHKHNRKVVCFWNTFTHRLGLHSYTHTLPIGMSVHILISPRWSWDETLL